MTKEQAARKAELYRNWVILNEQKLQLLEKENKEFFDSFDWTEPVKHGHYSQRRHEKMFERRDNRMRALVELEEKIKRQREKAENLEEFSKRNKGDAVKEAEKERRTQDEKAIVGSRIYSIGYRKEGVIKKINKKTYTISFSSDWVMTLDKRFVEFLE